MSYFEGAAALKLSSWYVGNAEAANQLHTDCSPIALSQLEAFDEFNLCIQSWSHARSYCICIVRNISTQYIVIWLQWIVSIYMDRIIRPGCESQAATWSEWKVGAFGYCDAGRLGRRRRRLFNYQKLSSIFVVVEHGWCRGKRTLGLGHMSRKTPEVKIGLYSPLSQLTGCLKPREGICHVVGRVQAHFQIISARSPQVWIYAIIPQTSGIAAAFWWQKSWWGLWLVRSSCRDLAVLKVLYSLKSWIIFNQTTKGENQRKWNLKDFQDSMQVSFGCLIVLKKKRCSQFQGEIWPARLSLDVARPWNRTRIVGRLWVVSFQFSLWRPDEFGVCLHVQLLGFKSLRSLPLIPLDWNP